MITEDFVSLEVAKLLKEKGFSEPVHYEYHYTISVPQFHKKAHNFNGEEYANCETEWFSALTIQMAMKWLREVHGIDIIIEIFDPSVKDRKYYCMIWDKNNNSYILDLFNSYEETCESAIKYCIENLI